MAKETSKLSVRLNSASDLADYSSLLAAMVNFPQVGNESIELWKTMGQ